MVTISFLKRLGWGREFKPDVVRKPRFCVKLGVIAALALAGCATAGGSPDATRHAVLQPWIDITGAKTATLSGLPDAVKGGSAGYLVLRQPSAVSATGNDVYLADAGLRRIFRYDRAQQTLALFTNLTPGSETKLYAAPDLSLYVTDPARPQVLHFAWNGAVLAPLSSPGNLDRPISVAMDEGSGRVLVADGLYHHIVAFNSLGRPLSVIKPQRVRAIAAMTLAADGLYIVDRLARQVVVVGLDGAYRYAIGAGTLGLPGAIAVYGNLVLVSDDFDQTVKVYRGGQLVDTVGGAGVAPGRFNRIADLAADNGLLYVADSLNARIQIMLIAPEAVRKGE